MKLGQKGKENDKKIQINFLSVRFAHTHTNNTKEIEIKKDKLQLYVRKELCFEKLTSGCDSPCTMHTSTAS